MQNDIVFPIFSLLKVEIASIFVFRHSKFFLVTLCGKIQKFVSCNEIKI
jgi:hypothetical protein